jgi:hypothetical protein
LKLEIEKLRRTLYGARSERRERLVDQLEMQLAAARLLGAQGLPHDLKRQPRVDVAQQRTGARSDDGFRARSVCQCSG